MTFWILFLLAGNTHMRLTQQIVIDHEIAEIIEITAAVAVEVGPILVDADFVPKFADLINSFSKDYNCIDLSQVEDKLKCLR